MKTKTYSLKLTEQELWYLKCGYDASFTDPDSMSKVEKSASKKLNQVWLKARRERDNQKEAKE